LFGLCETGNDGFDASGLCETGNDGFDASGLCETGNDGFDTSGLLGGKVAAETGNTGRELGGAASAHTGCTKHNPSHPQWNRQNQPNNIDLSNLLKTQTPRKQLTHRSDVIMRKQARTRRLARRGYA